MTSDDRLKDPKFIKWANEIRERDNYSCQICFKRGSKTNAHHLNSWDSFPEERYDIKNGILLCVVHHEQFHNIYGFGNNTKYQFEEFKKFLEKIKKIAGNKNELE